MTTSHILVALVALPLLSNAGLSACLDTGSNGRAPEPIPSITSGADVRAVPESGLVQPHPPEDVAPERQSGRRLYVPVTGRVERMDTRLAADLRITVVLRNTDPEEPIRIDSVLAYDADGTVLQEYLSAAVELPPMGVRDHIMAAEGPGSETVRSIVVVWTSAEPVQPPMAEAYMVSAHTARGLSFRSVGRAIDSVDP